MRRTGVVWYWRADRPHGWIVEYGDSNPRLFVHMDDCGGQRFVAGERVTFDRARDPFGRVKATCVQRMGPRR